MALTDLFEKLTSADSSEELIDDSSMPDSEPDSVIELSDILEPDPKPSRGKSKKRSPSPAAKATAAQKKQVKDALTLLITIPTGVWAMKDPHCGGAAVAQREAIIDSLVPIVCRNPAWLKWFTSGDAAWLNYVALFTALQPVGQAVWNHHVRKIDPGEAGAGIDLSLYSAA